jgi:hypothetical protein
MKPISETWTKNSKKSISQLLIRNLSTESKTIGLSINQLQCLCMPSSLILASVVALSLIMLNVVILNVVDQGRGVLLHIVHYMVPCADRLYFEILN